MANKLRRILMFAPWFPPHRNSEANVNGKLAIAFQRYGWKLNIISSPRLDMNQGEQTIEIWQPLKDITFVVPASYLRRLQRITNRIQGVFQTGHPVRDISWANFAIQKARQLLINNEYDVILSRSQPAQGHLPALIISRESKIPWIANWNDLEPACKAPEPYGRGPTARPGLFLNRYLKTVIRSAFYHTFPCDRSRQYMTQIFPELNNKSTVIPHIAISMGAVMTAEKKTNSFILCHGGTFDGKRDPSPFFTGLLKFISDNNSNDIKVNLMGNTYEGILHFTIPPDLEKVIEIKKWCNYVEALDEMKKADVLLMIEAPVGEGIHLSGKFVDYVQCGRPILALAPKIGTLWDIMKQHGGGIVVDCTSSAEIASALQKLYGSWKHRSLDADYNTTRLRALFSEERVISQYERLFQKIVP